MLKYFQAQIVENHILGSLKYSWIQYPGSHIGKDYIKGITILPYSVSSEESMDSVKFHIKDHIEISDVYLGPLNIYFVHNVLCYIWNTCLYNKIFNEFVGKTFMESTFFGG